MLKEVGFLFGSLMVGHAQPKSTLKAVLMLTRHGDRAPNMSYPNDPHSSYEWPGGLGALSPRGEQQMTRSGAHKSVRYGSLISYKDGVAQIDNIAVISSAVHRCVETAKRFLNGFLSSTSWPEDLINVIPFEQDECLALNGKPCPAYIKTLYQRCSTRHPEAQEFLKSKGYSDELFEIVQKGSGMQRRSLISMAILDDIMLNQQLNGLSLPAWAEPIYKSFIQPVGEFCFDSMCSSKYMQIRSGVLLKNMIDRLDQFLINESNKNIVLYSAHDITIRGLMHTMDIASQGDVQPKYGSCFAVELHENSQFVDDYEVKVFYYRNYDDQDPLEVELPGIQRPYSFEQFKTVMEPKLTMDYDAICGADVNGRAKM